MVHVGRAILGVVIIVVIIVAAILAVPVALAGSFNVPVTTITFWEKSGSLTVGTDTTTNSTRQVTAYEYYFSIKPMGMVSTSETNVNASNGSANIVINMTLITPNNGGQSLPTYRLSGVALGNRTHTIRLGVDDGVRASGTYTLVISIESATKLASASDYSAATARGFQVTWKI